MHESAPGPPCIYSDSQIRVFMGFLSVQMNKSLILMPTLWFFSFCLFLLSNSNVIIIVLSYYVVLLSLRSLVF